MRRITRREFLKATGAVAGGIGFLGVPRSGSGARAGYRNPLPQVTLGKTGVQVSRLGLGGKGLLQEGTQADDGTAIQAINEAIDAGITYLDTCYNYDRSEHRIGVVMQTRRDEVFLVTKFGARTYDLIMPEVEQSLTKLHTTQVDLLQLHFVNQSDDVAAFGQPNGAHWTLCKLRDGGVCRFIGVTGHPYFSNVTASLSMYDWDCFLGFFNPMGESLGAFTDQIPIARTKNMGVVAMKSFGGGSPNAALIGESKGQAPYEDLLRYALSEPRGQHVDVVIPGISSSSHLSQLVQTVQSFQPMTEYECWLLEQRINQTYVWIGDLKRRSDGCNLEINDRADSGVIVTGAFPDCFYVQPADRTSGIKITNASAIVGQRIKVSGALSTDPHGNRYMRADSVTVKSSGASVRALGMPNSAVGGGDFEFSTGSGAGQRGVTDGAGPNNVGLLIKAWGEVVERGTGYFYIDDGSGVPSGSAQPGVRVDCGSVTPPTLNTTVSVTGISTLYKLSGSYYRCIRIDESGDIEELSPA